MSLPIFTRYLSPNQFGTVSLYSTILSVFTIVIGLNLWSGVVRYYFDNKNNMISINSINYIIIGNFFLCISIFIFLKSNFENLFLLDSKFLIIAIVTALFQSFFNTYLEVLRAEMKVNKYCYIYISAGIINNLLSVILIIIISQEKELWRIMAISFSYLIVGSYSLFSMIKSYGKKFSLETSKFFMKFSIPLLPFAFSSMILALFDRLVIGKYYSNFEIGIYSFSYNIAMMVYVIVVGLYKSFQPNYYNNINNLDFIKRLLKKYTIAFIVLYSIFTISLDLMLYIFGSTKYCEAKQIIPIINYGYAFFFFYSLYVTEIYYYKKTLIVSISTVFAAILNVILNYICIPKFGYIAAAYTTTISYFVLFLLCYLYVRFVLKSSRISIGLVVLTLIIITVITALKIAI